MSSERAYERTTLPRSDAGQDIVMKHTNINWGGARDMTTKGEYRVGIDFNPSGNANVDNIKKAAADLIDLIDDVETEEGEAQRLKALAQTAIEEGAMWAVKAITKKPWTE